MNQKFTLLLITFLITNSLNAQITSLNSNNLLFNNPHLTFEFGYLHNQVKQNDRFTKGDFNAYAGKGGFVGGKLTINPFTNLGLEIGTNICLQNFGYEVNLSAIEFDLPNDLNFRQSIPEVYIELPLAIVPRKRLNNNNWLYARLGMSMSWYAPLSLDFNFSSNPQNPDDGKNLGSATMNFFGKNPYFSALSGIGIQHITKSKDLIGLSLNANFGFSNILEGSYSIWDNEVTVGTGTFYSKGNFISLAFSYTFTGVKKMEEKINNLKIEN